MLRQSISGSKTYLAKAEQSLAGARGEHANRRYNNSANRAHPACRQAAIATAARPVRTPKRIAAMLKDSRFQTGWVPLASD